MIPNPILIPILALTVFRCVSPAQINSRWSRHPNPSSSSNTITTILPQKCSTREERARMDIVEACGVGGLSLMLGSVARMEAGGAAFSCALLYCSVASCDPLRGSPLAGEEEEEEGKLQKVVVHAQINSLARPAFQVTQKFSIPVPTSDPSSPKYYTGGRLNKKIVYHSSHSLSFTCPVVAKFLNVNQRNIKVTGRRTDKGWRENYNPSHHRHHHPNRKKESCKAGFSKADGIVS